MTTRNTKSNKSIVCEKLAAISLTAADRRDALQAVETGEQIAEALVEIGHVLRLLVATPHLKPSLKPSFRH